MNLHEYQSKQLFQEYDIPTPPGIVCKTIEKIKEAMTELRGDTFAIKCQVHTGGRGKAGGVKLVSSKKEGAEFGKKWFGKKLSTFQTGPEGLPVHRIYVEEIYNIKKELYLSAVVDRSEQKIVFIASSEGGMDIEEVAEKTPELIHKITVDPTSGAMPYQGRELAFKLGLKGDLIKRFTKIFLALSQLFKDKDLALLEVNPLVVTDQDRIFCLDAKINVDDNALYRHPELAKLSDHTQQDERERIAEANQLNYVSLGGNIGCMVNGAGLAMGTMDSIKAHGGEPANFLDVGGRITADRVGEAFKLILSDEGVKAILVNVFGGIVRCDVIAEGIIEAINEIDVNVPVIARLEGNSAEEARELLANCDLNIIPAASLTEGATLAVKAATEGAK